MQYLYLNIVWAYADSLKKSMLVYVNFLSTNGFSSAQESYGAITKSNAFISLYSQLQTYL